MMNVKHTTLQPTQTIVSQNNPVNEKMWTGHFWKHVDEECYYKCKNAHGVEGQVCFWICMTPKVIDGIKDIQKIVKDHK